MRRWRAAALVGALATVGLAFGTAAAQLGTYIWSGTGRASWEAPSCIGYRMTVQVTINDGRAVGLFQQEGRQQRNFDIPLQANGTFKGEAVVGGGGKMQVTGRISGDSGEILLDGYCKFGGTLKRA